MNALQNRIDQLIFSFQYTFDPNSHSKSALHLDYDDKIYRQKELVKIIRDTITQFALTPKEFADMSASGDIGEMQRIAWSRISKAKIFKKGDYGELLLFIILSIIHKIPKFVTKVRLRSSVKEQIKGFDCAHFTIENGEPILWLGEAKFHKSFSGALTDAVDSINAHFEREYLEDELSILGSNIEGNSGLDLKELQKAFQGKSLDKIKFRVPILLTYDSSGVKNCSDVDDVFKRALEKELKQKNDLIENKVFNVSKNVELFFIVFPLHTVEEIKRELDAIESLSR